MCPRLSRVTASGVFIVAALFSPAVASPAPSWEDKVVLVIDDFRPVTAGDLAYYYARASETGAPPDWRELVDAVAAGEVLVREAEIAGFGADAGVAAALDTYRRWTLAARGWAAVTAGVDVSDEEVAAFYEKSRSRRIYSFIETDDPGRAAEAWAALRAGARWDDVVASYSDFKGYTGASGAWEVPMEYDATPPAEALFALGPGEFTAPIPDAAGLAWFIYRLDKVVRRSPETLAEARPGIAAYLSQLKVERRFRELAAGWRQEAPVTRNDGLLGEILSTRWPDAGAAHVGRNEALADAGGIAVPFDAVAAAVEEHYASPEEEIERRRQDRPASYRRVWEHYLEEAEDQALLAWRALADGADREPAFRRAVAARRADLLIDKLYEEQFLSGIPDPTAEEVAVYYESRRADFYIPERVEVYLVAMPAREEVEEFYAAVKGGADLVVAGEARNRARTQVEREAVEAPPSSPGKQEWLGVVVITREPPTGAEGEAPLAAELRPRAFPFAKLNELSDIFRLADGRGAFFAPVFYEPGRQRPPDDAEVNYFCRKAVWEARLQSPEVVAAAENWLAGLKARHTVAKDEEALGRLAVRLGVPQNH